MELAGWYHLTLRTVTVASVPVLGEVENVTESHIVAYYETVDGQTQGRHDVCTIEVRGSTDIVQTTLPDAFVDALPINRYTVDQQDGRIEATFSEVVIGYDASKGELPATIADPQVADTDGDGFPAATIRVDIPLLDGVDARMAQHNQVRIEGSWTGERYEGVSSLVIMEAVVLEADHPLFTRQPELRATEGDFTLTPLPARSSCESLSEG